MRGRYRSLIRVRVHDGALNCFTAKKAAVTELPSASSIFTALPSELILRKKPDVQSSAASLSKVSLKRCTSHHSLERLC